VGARLVADDDFVRREGEVAHRINAVPKDMPRLGVGVALADLGPQETIEAAGHERQLQVTRDLQGHGRREGIQMEEVDAIGKAVFDAHPWRVAFDEGGRCTPSLVGEQHGRLFMA
jgi:hypothetical protein